MKLQPPEIPNFQGLKDSEALLEALCTEGAFDRD